MAEPRARPETPGPSTGPEADAQRISLWVAAAAVVTVVAVTVVTVLLVSTGGRTAALPPLQRGPDIYRVHAQPDTSTNGRNVAQGGPNVQVNSTNALVVLRSVVGDRRPKAVMQIWVAARGSAAASYRFQHGWDARAGGQLTVGALHFRVLHVWQRAGTAHDAVDPRVTAAS